MEEKCCMNCRYFRLEQGKQAHACILKGKVIHDPENEGCNRYGKDNTNTCVGMGLNGPGEFIPVASPVDGKENNRQEPRVDAHIKKKKKKAGMKDPQQEFLNLLFQEHLENIAALFKLKNNTYKSASDPFANFTNGGMLRHGAGDWHGKFEAFKDYVTKHIVTVMNNDIEFDNISESLQDIAVYSIIAMVMRDGYVLSCKSEPSDDKPEQE